MDEPNVTSVTLLDFKSMIIRAAAKEAVERGVGIYDLIAALNEASPPSERAKRCVERARRELVREGELEIDEISYVSEGTEDSGGCYVMAWAWVDDPDAEGCE